MTEIEFQERTKALEETLKSIHLAISEGRIDEAVKFISLIA